MDKFSEIEAGAHSGAMGNNNLPEPTDGQKVAGNYKMGRISLHGMRIAIENPRGSVRSGVNQATGVQWSNRMAAHYGYIEGTTGADGDGIDVFIGYMPESTRAFVINQINPNTKEFDEHKVMLAFPDAEEAKAAYQGSYDRGWAGFGNMIEASVSQVKWWAKNGDMTRPLVSSSLPVNGYEDMSIPEWVDGDEHGGFPLNASLDSVLYDIRRHDQAGLMFDPIEVMDIISDADEVVALDALVIPFSQMERKLSQIKAVMERSGNDVKPIAMQITDPFKQHGVTNVAAVFELSDGQTISAFFHNPDNTPNKLAPADEMISWKWLLNKKDITIVVAPENGNELNPREVARRIMRLAEKNSSSFQRANIKRTERMGRIASLKESVSSKEVELSELQKILAKKKEELEKLTAGKSPAEPADPIDLVRKATSLGKQAFADGKRRAPALNSELMDLLSGLKVGESGGILQAYIRAWDAANFAHHIPEALLAENAQAEALPSDSQKEVIKAENEPVTVAEPPSEVSPNPEVSTDSLEAAKVIMQTADFKSALAAMKSSANFINTIDNGGNKGYNRSLFVSSISNKMKVKAKNSPLTAALLLAALFEMQGDFKKPAVTMANGIWKLVPDWEQYCVLFKKQDAKPIASADEGQVQTPSRSAVIVVGSELGSFPDTPEGIRELRSAAKSYLMGLRGEWVDCASIGRKVEIRTRGIKEMMSFSADARKLKILSSIKSIIATAFDPKTEENFKKDKKPHVISYLKLKNIVELAGESISVDVVIEEDDKGLLHYDMLLDAGVVDTKTALDSSSAASVSGVSTNHNSAITDTFNINPGETEVNAVFDSVSGMVLNLFIVGEKPEIIEVDPAARIQLAIDDPIDNQAWLLTPDEIKALSVDDYEAMQSKLTAENWHSEALIVKAARIGTLEQWTEANSIEFERDLKGSLTADLSVRRDALEAALQANGGGELNDQGSSPLDVFEGSGGEAWQVTCAKWKELMRGHFAFIGQTCDRTDEDRFAEFHRGAVKSALDSGKAVSDDVLADYPGMKAETQQEKDARYAEAETRLENFISHAAGEDVDVKANAATEPNSIIDPQTNTDPDPVLSAPGGEMSNPLEEAAVISHDSEPGADFDTPESILNSADIEEPAQLPIQNQYADDEAFMQSVIDGKADIWEADLAGKLEAILGRVSSDVAMQALWMKAINAYSSQALALAQKTMNG
ncbi:defense against restriction DarA-related protein [Undibacterium crateris]|uniref:defense against restriction DarA-related protein n=1 Tax=Undibacterium crateris TaxID=2528175 RepID=UPI001389D4E8|nr:hypothetical protein [Undibacterium crateris]NDI85071.1 hypothetical protein [Undibacterium crateris]